MKHYEEAGRFLYVPSEPPQLVAKSAMKKFLKAYFNGSLELAFSTLISAQEADIDDAEFDRLHKIIDEAASARKEP